MNNLTNGNGAHQSFDLTSDHPTTVPVWAVRHWNRYIAWMTRGHARWIDGGRLLLFVWPSYGPFPFVAVLADADTERVLWVGGPCYCPRHFGDRLPPEYRAEAEQLAALELDAPRCAA